eukprot:2751643-Rhodomonas_salina.2
MKVSSSSGSLPGTDLASTAIPVYAPAMRCPRKLISAYVRALRCPVLTKPEPLCLRDVRYRPTRRPVPAYATYGICLRNFRYLPTGCAVAMESIERLEEALREAR